MAGDEATRIDAAASVEGKLKGRNAEILGRFKGEVTLEGRLVLGSGGRLEATVEAAAAEIAGSFQGELKVGKLQLLESARVEGNIEAKALSIHEGAVINGSVNSGAEPAKPAPKPISPAATQKLESSPEASKPGDKGKASDNGQNPEKTGGGPA